MNDAHAINLSWLLRLRWGAIVGQVALILGVHFGLGMSQRLGPLFATITVAAASNVALGLWSRRARILREWQPWAVMALDVVLLTALLYLMRRLLQPLHHAVPGEHRAGRGAAARAARRGALLRWPSLLAFGSLFLLQEREPPFGLKLPGHAQP